MPDAEAVAAAEAADATAARRHGLGPTPTARFRAMLANPDKLNAIVDGMASALASVLSLKDADCDLDPRSLAAKPTLCELFYEKGSYWSTPAKQREQEKCIEMFYFASDCESLAARMRAAARQRDNLLLAEFSRAEPYCFYQECFRCVGQTRSRVLLGRFGGALRDAVHDLAHDWLCACDHAMCQAFQDFDRESAATPRFVDADRLQVFDELCGTIAQRVTMMAHPTLDGRELSVRLLEELGAELLAHSAPLAEATKTRDLAALDAFLSLARRGLKEATGALLDWARDLPALVRHLRYVLERPPVELCLHGANAAKMNLPLLARAAVPDELDYFVRVDLLQLWHEQHGVFAAAAAQHAIEQVRRWTTERQSAFIGVLHTADVVRDPLEACRRRRRTPTPCACPTCRLSTSGGRGGLRGRARCSGGRASTGRGGASCAPPASSGSCSPTASRPRRRRRQRDDAHPDAGRGDAHRQGPHPREARDRVRQRPARARRRDRPREPPRPRGGARALRPRRLLRRGDSPDV